MPTFNVDIDFEVFCTCGYGLCNRTVVGDKDGKLSIEVEPCDYCMQERYDEGLLAMNNG